MKLLNKSVTIAIAAVVGGVGGVLLASPETYTLADQVPGVATDRQCSFDDIVCNEIRSREIYLGQGWSYTRMLDDEATLKKKFIFGGTGATGLGFVAFGLTYFMRRKKPMS